MLAVIYLITAFLLGFVFCEACLPKLGSLTEKTYRGEPLHLSSLMIRVPAWFVTGTVILTWIAYVGACVFSGVSDRPLLWGDIIALVVSWAAIGLFLYCIINKKAFPKLKTAIKDMEAAEWGLLIFVSVLGFFLMYRTLNCDSDNIYVGLSVFSDFTPHISMIRSFSYMQNFPTQYTVSAGADVKYHFMFTFLVGNLEFLGLRLDHAFNIPSAFGFIGAFSVLYVLAVKLTGKKLAGLFACLMFAFRSSGAFLYYVAELPKGTVLQTLKNATDFIGVTPHEDWGLWNLNVYCNQRHFAFALTLLLIIVTMYLEPLYAAAERIGAGSHLSAFFKKSFLSKESWAGKNLKQAAAAGFILGALGFWNGAVLIATVIVLFFIAVFADRRLEYAVMALIAAVLSVIQTKVFIDGNALGLEYQYGFLAENPTVFGAADYLIKLLGVLPLILVISFCLVKAADRYVLFAFSMPTVFAFCVSMTPDIAVNHKYIMISVMLMNVFAAWLISRLFETKDTVKSIVAAVLVAALTVTGVYDLAVVLRRDKQENSIVVERDDPVTNWIKDNCSSKDLFLTSNYYLTSYSDGSRVIAAGTSLYNAWEYFGWSAGYDTGYRDAVAAAVYGAQDADRLTAYISSFGFDYVIIDRAVRDHTDFEVNEALFDETYPVVFSAHEGADLLKIYKTGSN